MTLTSEILPLQGSLPLFLLYGEEHPLFDPLMDELKNTVRFAVVSKTKPKIEMQKIYYISPEQAHNIPRVKDSFSYAVFFIQESKDCLLLQTLLPKLQKDKAKVALVIDVTSVELISELASFYKKDKNITLLIIGDLFGRSIEPTSSTLSQIVNDGLFKKKITLSGNDLNPIFPIYQQDALDAISHAVFGGLKRHSVYCVYYQYPQTVISAVHILKRLEPDLALDLGTQTKQKSPPRISNEQIQKQIDKTGVSNHTFAIEDEKRFEESLRRYTTNGQDLKPRLVGKILSRAKKISPPQFSTNIPSFIARILLVFIVTQLILVILLVVNSKLLLMSLEKKNIDLFSKLLFTEKILHQATIPLESGISKLPYINTFSFIQTYNQLPNLLEVGDSTLAMYHLINTHLPNLSKQQLDNLTANILYAYFEVTKFEKSSGMFQKDNTAETFSRLSTIVPFLSDLLGYNKPTSYIILFQNNAELRPTGGFIGSLGEVKLEKGSLKNFTIRDIYELDGQLKAHIEPHYIIRRFLQPHLYLRDSNFSPDFTSSASMSAKLYSLETDKQIDGVVGIDFEVMRELLSITGPITLFDYNTTLTKDNVLDFLHTTIEKDTFAGSTQKRDVLTTLYTKILEQLGNKANSAPQLAESALKMIRQKHIMFYFNNPAFQNTFIANDMAGSLIDLRKPTDNSILDTLSINEANIGVNKANQYIKRGVSYETTLNQQKLQSKVTLKLNNTAKEKLDYKAYLRVLTPPNSTLASIAIDGKKQIITPAITDAKVYENKKFKHPEGLEVDTLTEGNYQGFGFITTVPYASSQTIEVEYNNGAIIPKAGMLSYNLHYIKQPGTTEYPLSFQGISSNNLKSNTTNTKEVVAEDRYITVELSKK